MIPHLRAFAVQPAVPTVLRSDPDPRLMQIGPMTPSDLAALLDWLPSYFSNPTLGATLMSDALSAGAMLVGRIGRERVAGAYVYRSVEGVAYVGPVVVKPELRGHGLGRRMWQATLEAAGDGPLAAMVPARAVPSLLREGFTRLWDDVRMEGLVLHAGADDDSVVDAASVSLESLARYDESICRFQRAHLIATLLKHDTAVALVLLERGTIRGWGAVVTTRVGFRIGPLMADTVSGATRLFDALCARAGTGQRVHIDVPEVNGAAMRIAAERGLVSGRRLARMMRGDTPQIAVRRLFGASTIVGY